MALPTWISCGAKLQRRSNDLCSFELPPRRLRLCEISFHWKLQEGSPLDRAGVVSGVAVLNAGTLNQTKGDIDGPVGGAAGDAGSPGYDQSSMDTYTVS